MEASVESWESLAAVLIEADDDDDDEDVLFQSFLDFIFTCRDSTGTLGALSVARSFLLLSIISMIDREDRQP